ncbi:thyrotropin-releasing hormone receptor [Biomphalaria pfeifferi]|uniref:Thyrotropin-releasing hormone receptor n=1 Tax=Biomphalaria pfeifferi TaxID=112525 RepID=A0AAD8BBC8_BIOPF|nr:thyrotropin-releasing hormone receptor [Biomphalaria pfeifferi]
MVSFAKSSNRSSGIIFIFDNGDEWLSDYAKSLIIVVNHVIISTCICLFGIVGNCINISVFLKQGLRKSVNLSLCAMSFSDLFGLLFQVWHNFCLDPYLDLADLPVNFMEIQYLTAGCPNVIMKTAVILLFVVLLNVSSFLPLYFSLYLSWNFNSNLNKTKLGVSIYSNKLVNEGIMNRFQASLAIIAFILVVIFTEILAINLKRKSKWRRGVTSNKDQQEAMSSRESKTVGMIIVVAVVLIVCYTPGVTCSITTSFNPDFGITGKQANVFHAVWSFCFLFHAANSSINILLYYRMSSNYRKTLREIFPISNKRSGQRKNTHNGSDNL